MPLRSMSFRIDPTVLALTLITVDAGVSGMTSNAGDTPRSMQIRGAVETVTIGLLGAMVTKSWWPLFGPVAYLVFDYEWARRHGGEPELDLDELTERRSAHGY